MSINRWTHKPNAGYKHNGTLFIFKKEGNSYTCYSIDESVVHYANQIKSDKKGQKLYDCTCLRYLE